MSRNEPKRAIHALSITTSIWHVCISLRLTLILILIIICLGITGIFIIQVPSYINPGSPEYAVWLDNVARLDFGGLTDVLAFWGLFHIFRSPLFLGVGILLMLNILCCTVNRWHSIKSMLRRGTISTDVSYYQNAPFIYLASSKLSATVSSINNVLVRHRYRICSKESGDSVYIYADKYRCSPAGTLVSHLSLILLFIGLLLGNYLGFSNDNFIVTEGTVQEVGYNTGLSLELLSFEADYWDDGVPRDYRSKVIVYQDGRQVTQNIIRVNHPLMYSGVHFYQSFFGQAVGMKVRTTDGVEILDRSIALTGTMNVEPFQRPVGKLDLPGTGLTAYLIAPAVNIYDPVLMDGQIGIELYRNNSTELLYWTVMNKDSPVVFEEMEFIYSEDRSFSGFKVKSTPGIWSVWLAFGFFIVGIIPVLFFPSRYMRIMIKPDNEGTKVFVRFSGQHTTDIETEREGFYKALNIVVPGCLIQNKCKEPSDD